MRFPKNFQPVSPSILFKLTDKSNHTCWHFEVLKALLLCDIVDGLAGGHTSGQPLDTTLLEVRDCICPVGDDGHRVGGSNERAFSVDHVPVAISITGSAEWDVVLLNGVNQCVRIGQVGIGVESTEVWKGHAVLDGRFRQAKCIYEKSSSIWAGDAVKTVEQYREVGLVFIEEFLDEREVKDRLKEGNVIRDRVYDGDFAGAVSVVPYFGKIDLE